MLLELLGEAEIGQGQVELATTLGCQVMLARGERLQGYAFAASTDPAAKRHLDATLCEFVRLGMPFETARTRPLLSQTLSEPDPEVAEAEARAALVVFENLGANVNAAATLLRGMETKTREQTSKTSDLAGLSRREVEVLRSVAPGMSNQDIADRLVLSKHAIHRHASSILTKLDLPSRASAAAYAAEQALVW